MTCANHWGEPFIACHDTLNCDYYKFQLRNKNAHHFNGIVFTAYVLYTDVIIFLYDLRMVNGTIPLLPLVPVMLRMGRLLHVISLKRPVLVNMTKGWYIPNSANADNIFCHTIELELCLIRVQFCRAQAKH